MNYKIGDRVKHDKRVWKVTSSYPVTKMGTSKQVQMLLLWSGPEIPARVVPDNECERVKEN